MKKFFFVFLIFAFSILASWPLLRSGFFESHDGEWMVIRLTAFHQSLADGHFPVRWVERLNHGYGYPVMNFLYPLPFYLAEAFHLLNFSFQDSIKIVFGLSIFFSALFMYFFAREIWGKFGGVLAAIFYIWAPYRFVDLYARGSLGESLSFVFIPLIFLSVFKLSQKLSFFYLALGAISTAALITSHNVIAFIFAPVIVAYAIYRIWQKSAKVPCVLAISASFIWGLTLSAFFWIPALNDLQFVVQPQTSISNVLEHLLSFPDLISPRFGYGPAMPGQDNSISFQVGLVHIFAVLISIFTLFYLWKKDKGKKGHLLFFLGIFVISLLLMLRISNPFWQTLKPFGVIQFPWRMLSLVVFSSAFILGSLAQLLPAKKRFLIFLGLPLVFVYFSYTFPGKFIQKPESFYTTNEDTTTVRDEFMPRWVKNLPKERASSKIEFENSQTVLREEIVKTTDQLFFVYSEKPAAVTVNTVYFPGWQLFINEMEQEIDPERENGLIVFDLDPKYLGENIQIRLQFQETPIRQLANIISFSSFSLMILFLIYLVIFRAKKVISLNHLSSRF